MSDKKYAPGYIEVPGKGSRYRNASGEYFDNHWGSIANSFGKVFSGAGKAYNQYYNGVADSVGTERRDGTVKKRSKNSTSRGGGLTFDKSGRPYIMIDGRRVYQGEAASRYEEQPEAAVDNIENLEGGSHYTGKETGSNSSRNTAPPRGGADANAKGTQMGGKAALADFDAFESRLGDLGINFNFGTSQLPTSGNHHQKLTEPGQNQDGTYKMPEYVMYQGQAVPTKEVFGNDYQGGYYGTAKVGNTADKSDVSRALDFGDDGDDEDSMLYNNYGNEEPIEDEYGGYEGRDMNARSRAFLDHPGGSMMALRAAEAAQNTIRQNGNTYGKNAEGKWVRLSKDAASELKNDGNMIATSQYVTDNTYESKPAKSHAQETLDKHLKVNKEKLSHGEYLDLTNDGPLTPETNEVSFKNGKTMTMEELMENEDLWEENY